MLLLGGAVLVGASVQRMSGIGFGLVSAPALVLLLGPVDGVALTNCASAVICAVGFVTTWRQVRWAAMAPLVLAALATVPLGAYVARRLSDQVLLTAMGALVTLAVLLIISGARVPSLRGKRGAVGAGAVGGFMNASAGIGGPVLSLYTINAGWTAREFVPSAQFYGLLVNLFSVTAKGLPGLPGQAWLVGGGALVGGLLAGHFLAARTPERGARFLLLTLALGGGLVTMAKGIWAF